MDDFMKGFGVKTNLGPGPIGGGGRGGGGAPPGEKDDFWTSLPWSTLVQNTDPAPACLVDI